MKVLTYPSSYQQSSSGAVFGSIWFEVRDQAFPEANWSDIVLAVLRGWLEQVEKLADKKLKQGNLFFMDGPFEVHILKQENERWRLIFLKRGGKVYDVVEVNPTELVDLIVGASVIAIKGCLEKNFESKDLRILKTLVQRLKKTRS